MGNIEIKTRLKKCRKEMSVLLEKDIASGFMYRLSQDTAPPKRTFWLGWECPECGNSVASIKHRTYYAGVSWHKCVVCGWEHMMGFRPGPYGISATGCLVPVILAVVPAIIVGIL